MACCYGYENARTTKDEAIGIEDMSIKIDNITKEDKLYT
jgi:hypothetical protein